MCKILRIKFYFFCLGNDFVFHLYFTTCQSLLYLIFQWLDVMKIRLRWLLRYSWWFFCTSWNHLNNLTKSMPLRCSAEFGASLSIGSNESTISIRNYHFSRMFNWREMLVETFLMNLYGNFASAISYDIRVIFHGMWNAL